MYCDTSNSSALCLTETAAVLNFCKCLFIVRSQLLILKRALYNSNSFFCPTVNLFPTTHREKSFISSYTNQQKLTDLYKGKGLCSL
jgi:hypothetical protein